MNDLKLGTKVKVQTWAGGCYVANIEGQGKKNGRKVYDLDNGHWCYADQITFILTAFIWGIVYELGAIAW